MMRRKAMKRSTVIRAADAIEDLMTETGRGATLEDRHVWWVCKPLWHLLQDILRRWER